MELIQLAGHLGCDTMLSSCLDYFETQPRILLNPLTVLPAWTALHAVAEGLEANAAAFGAKEKKSADVGPTPTSIPIPMTSPRAPPPASPRATPRKQTEDVASRLAALLERMRLFCAECFDAIAADTQSQAGVLPRPLVEAILSSPELRCASDALVLRFLTLWSKGPSPPPSSSAAVGPSPRRRTNDDTMPDRMEPFYALVKKFVKMEVLPTDNLIKLHDQFPELAPSVVVALTAKSKLFDQLLVSTGPEQVEAVRASLSVRTPLLLPRTVHIELHGLRAFYAPGSEVLYPASLMTYAFSIPGAPGLWYLRVDPFGKSDETKDAYISYFLYSVGFTGVIEAILTVDAPCWAFQGTKTLRMKGGSGQGAAKGVPLPPADQRYTEAMGDTDTLLFALTLQAVSFATPAGGNVPNAPPPPDMPPVPQQMARESAAAVQVQPSSQQRAALPAAHGPAAAAVPIPGRVGPPNGPLGARTNSGGRGPGGLLAATSMDRPADRGREDQSFSFGNPGAK